MRAVFIVAALLFAGCAGTESTESQNTEPVSGDPLGALPEDLLITDAGDLMDGASGSWEFSLDPRVQSLVVNVEVTREAYADPATHIAANLYLGGSFVAGTGDGPAGNSVSVGNTEQSLVNYEERVDANNETLEHLAGDWALVIDGQVQPGTYSVSISAKY